MAQSAPLQDIFLHFDANQSSYIDDLKHAVNIASVPSAPENIMKMILWVEGRLKAAGAKTELCPVDSQPLEGESKAAGGTKLPPLLLATVGKSSRKPTVVVYGHLDVHPARAGDWLSDPFTLTERDGQLFGRGASDNKGPVLCWLHLLEAYRKTGREPPVNLRLLLDSGEEVGSPGLDSVIRDKKEVFKGVQYVCITDGMFRENNKPCIVHGTRGFCYYHLTVAGSKQDLHSGRYGGVLHEPMADLIYLLDSFHNKHGKIQIPKLNENVVQPTKEDEKALAKLPLDVEALRSQLGAARLLHAESKTRLLMHRWRLPSLTLHGIAGGFSGRGGRTVVPRAVTGKFSLRLVPQQTVARVADCVRDHVQAVWRARGSPNCMELRLVASVEPWLASDSGPHVQAMQRAVKQVLGVEPEVTRSGASSRAATALQQGTGASVLVLPLGARDDATHGQNEHLGATQYIRAHKVLAAYLHELTINK